MPIKTDVPIPKLQKNKSLRAILSIAKRCKATEANSDSLTFAEFLKNPFKFDPFSFKIKNL